MKQSLLFIALLMLYSKALIAQVGINTDNSTPNPSAMLDVQSTTKGMLIPRMTSALRAAIGSPVNGLMVYQTDGVSGVYYYNGSVWQRIGDADGSETKVTAGANVTVTGTGTLVSPYVINASGGGNSGHYIGELFGGGVVFWVDQTGNHGLICSMIDNSTGIIIWTTGAYQSTTVPAPGALSDWNGQANTNAIIAQAGAGSTYATGLCDAYTNADYGTGVFSDWYLPSRGELNDLWNSIKAVQKALDSDGNSATTAIAKAYYWSSTESSSTAAWGWNFINGSASNVSKSSSYWVRAVRAF
jgi:hypothetical protein